MVKMHKYCASINTLMNLQVIVSLGSGPWDQLFGGGNSPSIAVAGVASFASGLMAILALPRSRTDKSRVHVMHV